MKKKVALLAEASLDEEFDRWDHDDFFVNHKKQLDADDFGPICPPHLLDNPDGVGTASRWRKRKLAERMGPDVWATSDDESDKKEKEKKKIESAQTKSPQQKKSNLKPASQKDLRKKKKVIPNSRHEVSK